MVKRRFSSRLARDEITTRGYRVLTFAKCTTVVTIMHGYEQTGILSRLVGMGWNWYGFGLACVELYDI
jgi:hypothetical protein